MNDMLESKRDKKSPTRRRYGVAIKCKEPTPSDSEARFSADTLDRGIFSTR